MAKSRKAKSAKYGGPFVAVAVFCESVIEEKPTDPKLAGVFSVHRIIDTITAFVPPEGIPEDVTPMVALKALISFKAGDVRGLVPLKLVMRDPNGKQTRLDNGNMKVAFRLPGRGAEQGHNTVVNLGFVVQVEGVYWLDVFLDNKLMSRMPLKVALKKSAQASSQTLQKSPK